MKAKSWFLSWFRNEAPAGLIVLAAGFIFGVLSDQIFYIEIMTLAAIYAVFAMSWDILTGYTHDVNFGFAFFVGGAGYISGIANLRLGLSPALTIPLGALTAGIAGIIVGYLTLRLKGPYFAMVTLAFASILFKLAFLLYSYTGGEEGISGLTGLTSDPRHDFLVVWVITTAVYLLLRAYAKSKHGSILKAIRADEDATQSSGINTAYYKIEAFALSGFLGGIGGAVFAHSQMQVGPTMLSGHISILVVLLAMIGGMGTIVGPLIGAIALSLVNDYLRVIEQYRIVIYSGLLILLIYLAPEGLVNLRFVKRSKMLSFLFHGQEKM
ncbi:branched-chain amino acid ABC transporter permease [Desulfomonile tiedjei]|uniref:Amino acid/amide ABC transporter membrane protein 2, HAAT family n=1 Tax=Desulfomonile tiedjei (strain ATCC 49306 / DSM 6799 / DCB-1) TaxID=706587 RepID=I4C5L0_DESTA|nr:branched-chain amino acid ABC transporter permease [Desulfomonile tiedjei]AFM24851.1 amino acid/amide ABC transporter membrane protein 2, HAAT family [Desulfomonile tiedjei DSM 6799]